MKLLKKKKGLKKNKIFVIEAPNKKKHKKLVKNS